MLARDLLELLLDGTDLHRGQASTLMDVLLDPEVSETVKGGLLVALRAKGETPEEVRGLVMGMRAAAVPFPMDVKDEWVDTCGTGGDGHHSFNVSTATALLLAAAGETVVKHGNRSVSSSCGSADILEAVGVPLHDEPDQAAALLKRTGFTFLFAPSFHPTMRSVVPVRRALKVRTVFNILGPLSNPAQPRHQLVGAYSAEAAALMAETLSGLPITRCFVVHGEGGWDEATPCGTFELFDVTPGHVRRYTADPVEYGIARCTAQDLAGGDAEHNARLLRSLFESTAFFDAAVPIDRVADYQRAAETVVAELCGDEAVVYSFGHLGDGNLHLYVNSSLERGSRMEPWRVDEVQAAIDRLTWEMGGTVSAEHGVGQELLDRVVGQKSAVELAMMRRVKVALDPDNLFNPGRGAHSAPVPSDPGAMT